MSPTIVSSWSAEYQTKGITFKFSKYIYYKLNIYYKKIICWYINIDVETRNKNLQQND